MAVLLKMILINRQNLSVTLLNNHTCRRKITLNGLEIRSFMQSTTHFVSDFGYYILNIVDFSEEIMQAVFDYPLVLCNYFTLASKFIILTKLLFHLPSANP
jgi:hypothetical protein